MSEEEILEPFCVEVRLERLEEKFVMKLEQIGIDPHHPIDKEIIKDIVDFDFFCSWMQDSLEGYKNERLTFYFDKVIDDDFKDRKEELKEYFD